MKTTTEGALRMHNPPHPGEIIAEECLKPLGLTVTEAARGLRVSRKTLSAILNGRAGITADMALRLAQAFGATAEVWLRLQVQWELWQAEQRRGRPRIRRLVAA